MRIGSLIRRAARYYGDTPCLTEDDRTISFADFDTATDRVGNALIAVGFNSSDRVSILLPNSIDCLIAYYGAAKAGLIRIPLNARETRNDHEYKLTESGSRGLIHDNFTGLQAEISIDRAQLTDMIENGDPLPCTVEQDFDDTLRFAFTGGTSGQPKAVVLSIRSEMIELSTFLRDLMPDLKPGDRFLHAAPIAHASGSFFLPSLARGVTSVIMKKFDPKEFIKLARETQASHTLLVPTMLAMIVEEIGTDHFEHQFRNIVYSASSISPSLIERSEKIFGRIFVQAYGQQECPLGFSMLKPEDHDRIGSCGRPFELSELAIFDENDNPLPPGEHGEIVCRGPQVMTEYWNRPEETARKLRNGWLHSGDMGYMDNDGFFYIIDRKDDLIISGGFNVYPSDVENVLMSFPGVVEAAVVGIPDQKWGERIAAVVAGRSDIDLSKLQEHARANLASYKCPRSFALWPELPKSGARKILRRRVREELSRAAPLIQS